MTRDMPGRLLALAALLMPVAAAAESAPSVCISNIRIDHTDVQNDRTILFYMQGHEVYRNTLLDRCVGLRTDTRGFTYEPTDNNDLLCSNLVTIRLNSYGSVCQLGAFVRIR